MQTKFFFLFFMLVVNSACTQTLKEVEILSKQAYKKAISATGIQLVDVRSPKEYMSGHIHTAVNIDYFDDEQFVDKFSKFDKDAPIYIYCRSGNRSQKAAKKLVALGFTKIYDLKGGYKNWIAE